MVVAEHLLINVEKRNDRFYCNHKFCGREVGYVNKGGNTIFLQSYRECRQEHLSTVSEYNPNGVPVSLIVNRLIENENASNARSDMAVDAASNLSSINSTGLSCSSKPSGVIPHTTNGSASNFTGEKVSSGETTKGSLLLDKSAVNDLVNRLVEDVLNGYPELQAKSKNNAGNLSTNGMNSTNHGMNVVSDDDDEWQ